MASQQEHSAFKQLGRTCKSIVNGYGEEIRSTWEYQFPPYPDDYDGNDFYFTITAYVYRWDLSVYEKSYDIDVRP